MRRHGSEDPVLITNARPSSDDEYEHRRRKYALMMSIRIVAVIAAALCYRVSIWLSLAFLVAGAVLPWCAVLIANDNPPRAKQLPIGPVTGPAEKALPPAPDPTRTIDG